MMRIIESKDSGEWNWRRGMKEAQGWLTTAELLWGFYSLHWDNVKEMIEKSTSGKHLTWDEDLYASDMLGVERATQFCYFHAAEIAIKSIISERTGTMGEKHHRLYDLWEEVDVKDVIQRHVDQLLGGHVAIMDIVSIYKDDRDYIRLVYGPIMSYPGDDPYHEHLWVLAKACVDYLRTKEFRTATVVPN